MYCGNVIWYSLSLSIGDEANVISAWLREKNG